MENNEWQEVPAWQAMKAYHEGTHDVEQYGYYSAFESWGAVRKLSEFSSGCKHRIRPKQVADPLELLGKWCYSYKSYKISFIIDSTQQKYGDYFYGTLEECKAKYKELNK
jgi:hypothetical protein